MPSLIVNKGVGHLLFGFDKTKTGQTIDDVLREVTRLSYSGKSSSPSVPCYLMDEVQTWCEASHVIITVETELLWDVGSLPGEWYNLRRIYRLNFKREDHLLMFKMKWL